MPWKPPRHRKIISYSLCLSFLIHCYLSFISSSFSGPLPITQQIKAGPVVRNKEWVKPVELRTNLDQDCSVNVLHPTCHVQGIKSEWSSVSKRKNELHKPPFSTTLGFSGTFTYGFKGRARLTAHSIPAYPCHGCVGITPQCPVPVRNIPQAFWGVRRRRQLS